MSDLFDDMPTLRGFMLVSLLFCVCKEAVKLMVLMVMGMIGCIKGALNWFGTISKSKAIAFVPFYNTYVEYSNVMNGWIGIAGRLAGTVGWMLLLGTRGHGLRAMACILILASLGIKIAEGILYRRKMGRAAIPSVFVFAVLRLVYYMTIAGTDLGSNQEETNETVAPVASITSAVSTVTVEGGEAA